MDKEKIPNSIGYYSELSYMYVVLQNPCLSNQNDMAVFVE